MVHHTRAVARGVCETPLIADLPAHSTETARMGVSSARKLAEAGAKGVKPEGGRELLPVIKGILSEGIPVLGHIGMLPQKVKEEGGYKVKGKDPEQAEELIADALALDEAGVFGLVLELVSPPVAEAISRKLGCQRLESAAEAAVTAKYLLRMIFWGCFLGSSPALCDRR